jgi:threonine/homoserine/homoserine lactone efflux protein
VETSPTLTALAIGVALAGAPGPVQAVLLGEASRGGVARGLRALVGVHVTFGSLLTAIALGLSVAPPRGAALRALQLAGGALLVWLAWDSLRSGHEIDAPVERGVVTPVARGSLAILLNPGGWLFLSAVALPLLAAAGQRGGTGAALGAAFALVAGAGIGDAALVLLGGVGIRRAGDRVARRVRQALAVVLAGTGLWLLVVGALG